MNTFEGGSLPGHVLAIHGGDAVPFLWNGGQQQHCLEIVVQIHASNTNPLQQCPDPLDLHLRVLTYMQLGLHHLLKEAEVHSKVGDPKGILQAFPCLLSGDTQVGAEVG